MRSSLTVIDAGRIPYIDDPPECGALIAGFLGKPAHARA
jgi:hypothetical protein